MSRSERDIPEFMLERFVLEELPPTEQQALAARLDQDPDLRRRVQALRDSDRSLLQQYPAAWIGRQIAMRTQPLRAAPASSWWTWTRLWLIPAGAALIIIFAVPGMLRQAPSPETRVKGLMPQLQLFRQRARGGERLADSSLVRDGDRIQLVYLAAGAPYGAILSVDGAGVQTLHLPASGEVAAPLVQGRADTLAFSYELDAAPKWERFYFITADAPFDLAVVRRALAMSVGARGGPRLGLPPGLRQQVSTLIKPSRP